MNIFKIESLFFLFFGIFHTHRIWAFFDPHGYSDFWLSLLNSRGPLTFITGIILAILSTGAIVFFFLNRKRILWWRWIYLFGGIYLLIDSILNLLGISAMTSLVNFMFTAPAPLYHIIWGFFVLLGLFCLILSKYLWNYKEKQI